MMMLSRFLPERWRQSAEKKPTVFKPSAGDPARIERELTADDPATRRAAVARIDDLAVLQRLSAEDGDAGVREYARARLCKLIEGGGDRPLPLEERCRTLEAVLTPMLAERFAVKAAEPALRILALQGIEREDFCAERAVADPVAKVREAALARVHDPEQLAGIVRRARKRDKQISRSAKARWQALIAERQRQQAIEDVCKELENLGWDGETGRNAARFARLEQTWQSLAAEALPAQRERFRQVREYFQAHLRASAAQRQDRARLCQRLDELLERLQGLEEPVPEDSETARALRELDAQWAALGVADDPESRRLQRCFEERRSAVRAREQVLVRNARQAEHRCKVISRGESLAKRPGRLSGTEVKRIERDWQQLPALEPGVRTDELQARFERVMAGLRQRLADQVEAQAVEQAALETLLEQLEQALATGELQQAIDLQDQVRTQLAGNIGLDQQQTADFQRRLQSCLPRIARLRDWRRWGTNRSRESLIEAVEQLIGDELPPAELADQVQLARKSWQAMDRTDGVAPRALLKRFDRICEQAYAPVRVWRAEQIEQRRRNLVARKMLCEQIEQQLVALDTEQSADWRAVSRFRQQIRQQWREAGPVDRRQHKSIEQRFRTAMERLQERLQPVLEQELTRRRGIVERARALIDAEDQRQAVEAIKRLQLEWQPQVLASRSQEQALWKQFRAACDAVFARREEHRASRLAEQRRCKERRDAVIASAEALIEQLDVPGLVRADERFAALCAEWDELGAGPPDAGPSERETDQRFARVRQRFEQVQRGIALRRELDELRQLCDRAELCARAEHRVLQGARPAADELERLQEDWMAGTPLTEGVETALRQRFEQALQALREEPPADYPQRLRDASVAQQQHCLRLEILLGLDSPAEFAEARLQFRVAQLSESLGEREPVTVSSESWPEAVALLREGYLSPAPFDPLLEARRRKILEALEARV